MKKLTIFLVLTSFLFGEAALAEALRNTVLYNFEGRVSVVRKNRSLQADVDMPLETGDLVKVETGAYADFSLNYKVGMRLFETSECRVLGLAPSGMRFELARGGAIVNVRKMPDSYSFRLDTPDSSAIVGGTPLTQFSCKFYKKADGKTMVTYVVRKGVIDVKTSTATMRLGENQAIDVLEGGFIPNQRSSTEEESKAAYKAQQVYITEPEREDPPEL